MATIERIRRQDPETGIGILQLTSFPIMHWLVGSTGDSISPDGKTLLLYEDEKPVRGSARNLYRVNSDGSGLELLVERTSGGVVTVDGKYAVVARGLSIIRVPLDSGANGEEIARLGAYGHAHLSARSPDGRFVFGQAARQDKAFDILRFDLIEGTVEAICRASYLMPVQVHGRNGDRLLASVAPIDEQGKPRMPWGYWSFSFEGEDFRQVPFTRSTNHYVALGKSDLVVTCANHPANALDAAAPGDREARVLAQGAGFWHVTADTGGEWIASDTNWPDTGLKLVHAPSGRFRTLCSTGASGGHPQWTHAHPCLAPNAEYVLFTADRTGHCQVYLAPIPDAFKEELRRGE